MLRARSLLVPLLLLGASCDKANTLRATDVDAAKAAKVCQRVSACDPTFAISPSLCASLPGDVYGAGAALAGRGDVQRALLSDRAFYDCVAAAIDCPGVLACENGGRAFRTCVVGDIPLGTCDGNFVRTCVGTTEYSIDCNDFGLTCAADAKGKAVCGLATCSTAAPGTPGTILQCDLDRTTACQDGVVVIAEDCRRAGTVTCGGNRCETGSFIQVCGTDLPCDAYGNNFACQVLATGSRCAPTSGCADIGARAITDVKCGGSTLSYCDFSTGKSGALPCSDGKFTDLCRASCGTTGGTDGGAGGDGAPGDDGAAGDDAAGDDGGQQGQGDAAAR